MVFSFIWNDEKYLGMYHNHKSLRLVSLVGKVPVYRAVGSGSIPGRTNTQGLKIFEEKVLPLLCKWSDFRVFSDKDVKP